MSLNKLQIEYTNFIDNSIKNTIQVLYDVVLFDIVDNKGETLKDYITLEKRRRREVKINN